MMPTSHTYQSLANPIVREFGIYDGTAGRILNRTLSGTATISIPYTLISLGKVSEGSLRIFEYTGTAWTLVSGNQTVDTVSRKVTARVSHFSFFGLLAVQLKSDLSELKVYPNPYHPARAVKGTLKFLNLPPDVSVFIFTLEGEVVRALKGVDTGNIGLVEWDGRNTQGEEIAQGMYFWRTLDPQGRSKTGKIALIR